MNPVYASPPASGAVSNGFEIQPAAITGAAGCFDSEASALAEAATALDQELATVGACWGKDEVGERFGAEYQPAAQTVLENIDAIAVGFARIAAALRAVVTAHLRGDDDLLTLARAQESDVAAVATPAVV